MRLTIRERYLSPGTHTTAKCILIDGATGEVDGDIAVISVIHQRTVDWIVFGSLTISNSHVDKVCSHRGYTSAAIDGAVNLSVLDVERHVALHHTSCQCRRRALSSTKYVAVVA